jgi:hypothetical protein
MFGAVGTAVIQLVYKALGAGWTFVLFSGLCVVALPMPLAVLRYGRGWRIKRAERKARKGKNEMATVT